MKTYLLFFAFFILSNFSCNKDRLDVRSASTSPTMKEFEPVFSKVLVSSTLSNVRNEAALLAETKISIAQASSFRSEILEAGLFTKKASTFMNFSRSMPKNEFFFGVISVVAIYEYLHDDIEKMFARWRKQDKVIPKNLTHKQLFLLLQPATPNLSYDLESDKYKLTKLIGENIKIETFIDPKEFIEVHNKIGNYSSMQIKVKDWYESQPSSYSTDLPVKPVRVSPPPSHPDPYAFNEKKFLTLIHSFHEIKIDTKEGIENNNTLRIKFDIDKPIPNAIKGVVWFRINRSSIRNSDYHIERFFFNIEPGRVTYFNRYLLSRLRLKNTTNFVEIIIGAFDEKGELKAITHSSRSIHIKESGGQWYIE